MLVDSNTFNFVYGYCPKRWAERFNIRPHSIVCKCGRIRSTTIAFFIGSFRGLAAPPCPCGTKIKSYCLVKIDGDILMPEK